MYALIDANNFYVSCERAFNRKLSDVPVLVLSNNDGCVISRSQEVKNLGIKMGEPFFKIQSILEKNNVVVFSSNYELYGDMSHRLHQILREFSPEVEVYSIDEAFIRILPLQNGMNYLQYAQNIKNTISQYLSLPVGIGIGRTKTISKIANHLAKKSNGICVLDSEEKENTALKSTPIEEVWGIGRQYYKFLQKKFINTAWDFVQMPESWILKNMTKVGLKTLHELKGLPRIDLEEVRPKKQGIATTRSFSQKTDDFANVQEAIATHASRCSEKLRRQNSIATYLTVFIHTDPFGEHDSQYYNSKTLALPIPTNSQLEIVKFAVKALKLIFEKGFYYKKAGVIVTELMDENSVQGNLFYEFDTKQHSNLMGKLDEINKKYGKDTVKLAIMGQNKKWQLKRELLSPRYTTNWDEIIEIKAE